MADIGPRLSSVDDAVWVAHLDAEDVEAWYHNPRTYALLKRVGLHRLADATAPRGYSRSDRDGVPDAEDLVVLKASVYRAAVRAARDIIQDATPTRQDFDAFEVAWHEFLHCKVPWEGTVPARRFRELNEAYSHPRTAGRGVVHAARRGFAVNAFTGLLRWSKQPASTLLDVAHWIDVRAAQIDNG